jgi:hypothetical protein
MATVYMNGFEWNSYYENILSWSGATLTDDLPLSGSYCMYISGNSHFIRWQTTALNEFYIQVAFKMHAGYRDGCILKWYSDTTVLGSLTFNPSDQKLSIYHGDKASLISTSSRQLLYDQWYCVEIHVKLDTSSEGVIELRIDGESQFVFSGPTTTSLTTANLFYIVGRVSNTDSNATSYFWVDDIVINDTTGPNNNSWPNAAKIVLLFPVGRGNSTQWEKVAHLDNYENVDKYPTLDPVDYLLTNLNERLDLYLNNNLPVDAFSVGAVRVDAWALKNSGSDIMLNLALRTGGTTFISDDNELGVSYSLQQWLHQINPGTTTNWTVADVNDLESGMRSNIPD